MVEYHMTRIHELLETLAFTKSINYSRIRFREAVYSRGQNNLVVKFLYDSELGDGLATLKFPIESEVTKLVTDTVKQPLNIEFEYIKSYIDPILLGMKVESFLKTNFSILTLSLRGEDITVTTSVRSYHVEVTLGKQVAAFVGASRAWRDFIKGIESDHFADFAFHIVEQPDEGEDAPDLIEQYIKNEIPATERVDKRRRVSGLDYFLGKPIKIGVTKIKYLTPSTDDFAIAGVIRNMQRKEYTKKPKPGEQKPINPPPTSDDRREATEVQGSPLALVAPYFSFLLDDGDIVQCVFFPNPKNIAKFETLTDETKVVLIGNYSERNGRTSFRASGVSLCLGIE